MLKIMNVMIIVSEKSKCTKIKNVSFRSKILSQNDFLGSKLVDLGRKRHKKVEKWPVFLPKLSKMLIFRHYCANFVIFQSKNFWLIFLEAIGPTGHFEYHIAIYGHSLWNKFGQLVKTVIRKNGNSPMDFIGNSSKFDELQFWRSAYVHGSRFRLSRFRFLAPPNFGTVRSTDLLFFGMVRFSEVNKFCEIWPTKTSNYFFSLIRPTFAEKIWFYLFRPKLFLRLFRPNLAEKDWPKKTLADFNHF